PDFMAPSRRDSDGSRRYFGSFGVSLGLETSGCRRFQQPGRSQALVHVGAESEDGVRPNACVGAIGTSGLNLLIMRPPAPFCENGGRPGEPGMPARRLTSAHTRRPT